tara:strand:+ start:1407 stop:1559 length:153 start_codon:yes stop_codon:yes gene_type:complete
MLDTYYSALIGLLFISFGVGLFYSTTRARYFAYAGVVAYIVGLFGGAYYG